MFHGYGKPSIAPFTLLTFFVLSLSLTGCTNLHRLAHMYGDNALPPRVHQYPDGGRSLYYTFDTGDAPDTFLFFYGGSGCASWKSVMPEYVEGLPLPVQVFALNKRFVDDRSTGVFGCSRQFHEYNNITRWVSDYSDFISTRLQEAERPPENVVLVGVSEGAIPAARVAAGVPGITHLALLDDGGYSMRMALRTLHEKGAILMDPDAGWKRVQASPHSIDELWYGQPHRWWREMMDYDPLPPLLQLEIPILVAMGEADTSVPVESAYYLQSEFERAGKKNLSLVIYPEADHRLQGPEGSFRPDFFFRLGEMIRKTPGSQ